MFYSPRHHPITTIHYFKEVNLINKISATGNKVTRFINLQAKKCLKFVSLKRTIIKDTYVLKNKIL